MARLIRLKKKPHNWWVKKGLGLHPRNEIIPQSYTAELQDLFLQIDAASRLNREALKVYFGQKRDFAIEAQKRSSRKYRARLITETILLAIRWRLDLLKEASGIITTSSLIAAKILKTKPIDSFLPKQYEAVVEELSSFFSVRLYVSAKAMPILNKKHENLSQIFKEFFFPSYIANNARLWVKILDSSFSLDVIEDDVDQILNHVQETIAVLY